VHHESFYMALPVNFKAIHWKSLSPAIFLSAVAMRGRGKASLLMARTVPNEAGRGGKENRDLS
jgi:hypothetical protein